MADLFADPEVRYRCHLILTNARRYGAIRVHAYERGSHVTIEGVRVGEVGRWAVQLCRHEGLLMVGSVMPDSAWLVLSETGLAQLREWNVAAFGASGPATNEAANREVDLCDVPSDKMYCVYERGHRGTHRWAFKRAKA